MNEMPISEKKALDLLDKKEGVQKIVRSIFVALIFIGVIALLIFAQFVVNFFNENDSGSEFEESFVSGDLSYDEECNVSGIELRGELVTYIPDHAENDSFFNYDVTASENVLSIIKYAEEDEKIKAIFLEIDSPGGSPVAGEEIASALLQATKPSLALVRSLSASAAYWAISGADKIYASANSDVGGIGVTSSYLNNVKYNQKEGYEYEQLIAGKYKDYGSPDKPLTKEEKDLILRDLNIIYKNFIQAVSENRGIPLAKVESFADGASVLGEQAKALGLIDEIGGHKEASAYLEQVIGEKPEICW